MRIYDILENKQHFWELTPFLRIYNILENEGIVHEKWTTEERLRLFKEIKRTTILSVWTWKIMVFLLKKKYFGTNF